MKEQNEMDWYRDKEFRKWVERFDRFFTLVSRDNSVRFEKSQFGRKEVEDQDEL